MRTILLLFAALALAVPAAAEECIPTTSSPEVATCIGPVRVGLVGECEYVDNDLCQFNCLFSIWFYAESNGIEGLQRGDQVKDDTCGGLIEADTIWS